MSVYQQCWGQFYISVKESINTVISKKRMKEHTEITFKNLGNYTSCHIVRIHFSKIEILLKVVS